jgi:5-methylcytosine-specific restriction endonuclease McrA
MMRKGITMDVKNCTRCKEDKPLSSFANDASTRDGFTFYCKSCRSEYRKRYYQANRESEIASSKKRYDKDYESKKHKEWRRANPGKDLAKAAARRAAIHGQTPSWSVDDKEEVAAIYAFAKAWTVATGVLHHVDHVIPLRGKDVCGLHVSWNLRIVTASENLKKGNRLTRDITML